MILSYEHKAVFLAVPRTASRSITAWLTERGPTKVFGPYHGRDVPSDCAHWFTFAVVRHPYTRAVSFWLHTQSSANSWVLGNNDGGVVDNLFTRSGGIQSFENFASWLAKKRPDDPLEWGNQSTFIHGIRLNRLLHFETLQKDFRKLPFTTRRTMLPKIGAQLSNNDWTQHYNERSLQAVRGWAEKDFENFGYSLDYHITRKPFVQ